MTTPGELVRLGAGSVEVEVLPAVGARIHRLRVHGQDLVRVPADIQRHVDDPYFWGSYPMAPWCNRIAAGRTAVAGRELDLPPSFPDGTAIHGQVSRVPWAQTGAARFRIQAGGDGWPWPYEVEQAFSFGGDDLSLTLRLTNLADESMPAGAGIHPWFRRPVRVAINAAAVHPSNLVTHGEPEPVAGRFDRRALEELPNGLDAAWTDLSDPPIEFEWPSGPAAAVEVSDSARYVVAASPAEIDAIAVEPQTHAPAGVRRLIEGETGALKLLDPGETLELAVRFVFKRLNVTGPVGFVGDDQAMDRSTLRASIEAGRKRLDDALARFDDAEMLDRIDDEWTRKDVLAHIEAWERRVVNLLERLRAGDPLTERTETDELNAQFYARDRDRSLEDVRSAERGAYDVMLAALAGASDEELFDGSHFSWTEGDPFADWFRTNGDEHYDEHLEQLTRSGR